MITHLFFVNQPVNRVISGGNFHGMYIGMALDQLTYAMSILCNISERRLERLLNPALNGFLPEFLVTNSGLNSGLMIVQYVSAGITSENRQLANPATVGNIPTCNGTEDIVPMAGWAARKAIQSVNNTFEVLALELFSACLWLKPFHLIILLRRVHHNYNIFINIFENRFRILIPMYLSFA
jgi:histidine ammonia-lyase